MDIHEIIIKYLEVFFSWPIVAVVGFILFRKQLMQVIEDFSSRVVSAEIGGNKFEFSTSLEEESKVVEVLEQLEKENPTLLQASLNHTGTNMEVLDKYQSHIKNQVSKVQRTLQQLGYNIDSVDGRSGPKTREATRAFQKDYGLFPDGVVGPQTLGKIAQIENARRRSF